MTKFKPGDRVLVLNFQKGMIGTVVPDDEHPDLVDISDGFINIVKSDYGEYWTYRDEDIRKLTKLEKALS